MTNLEQASTPNPNGFREIDVQRLAASRGAVRLIDVREPSEYNAELGHIAGTELVPLATVGEAAKAWDRNQQLVVGAELLGDVMEEAGGVLLAAAHGGAAADVAVGGLDVDLANALGVEVEDAGLGVVDPDHGVKCHDRTGLQLSYREGRS